MAIGKKITEQPKTIAAPVETAAAAGSYRESACFCGREDEKAKRCPNKYCHSFGKQLLGTLIGILVVYLIFYVGALMRNDIKKFNYIGMADQTERTITVNGFGKVTGANDIATTYIGYTNTDKDVSKAQTDNKKVMDQVIADLKKLGIEDKDLQSDYSIYPDYNYTQIGGQQLIGYRVTNQITVKIRNLSKISDILSLSGKYGANQVGGLSFTIDDPENLKVKARDKALLDAKTKAANLASQLGVKLAEVVAYNEYEGGNYYPQPTYTAKALGLGMGGAAEAPIAPTVATGSQEVNMNVNITYKIASW